MATVTIEVTQADIDSGIPESNADCPIAHALHRVLADPWRSCAQVEELWVTWASLYPDPPDAIPLPPQATRFIELFDNEEPVTPFSFGLDIPDDLLEGSR